MSKKHNSHSHNHGHTTHAAPVTPVNPLVAIEARFTRLSQINAQLAAAKALYAERDALIKGLLPLFITESGDNIVVAKQITIGNKVHRCTPAFIKEGELVVKRWKSAAIETVVLE
jgi:hypothetical protein